MLVGHVSLVSSMRQAYARRIPLLNRDSAFLVLKSRKWVDAESDVDDDASRLADVRTAWMRADRGSARSSVLVRILEFSAVSDCYDCPIEIAYRPNMDFHARQQQALAILERTGMQPSSYAPPLVQLLWRLGVQVRPPHFMGFWCAAAVSGAWFGAVWGVLMWLMLWSDTRLPLVVPLVGACGAGLCFGLPMAGYYAYGKKKYQLPSWESLGGG